MSGVVRQVLLGIRTVAEMIEGFGDEERRRRLLETMVWPNGRVCPACGYKRSIALAGRDMGCRATDETGPLATIGTGPPH
jgi:Transposase zinc-ribbon domain